MCLEYEFVYQDVDTPFPGSSPYLNQVELAIPTGKRVVGSGALVTHVRDSGVLTPVDSVADATVVSMQAGLHVFSGPHPSDPTKWRVTISKLGTDHIRVRCWLTAIG